MTSLFVIFAVIEALMWGFKENRPAAITVHIFFGLPIAVAALMYNLTYTPEAPTPATAIVETAKVVDEHSWYDEKSSTLYVDDAWDDTPLQLADDIKTLYDANFEAKYEAAARETLSDEEFAAWQAARVAESDVIFTFVNGNNRIRYEVRHVVDVNTGETIR